MKNIVTKLSLISFLMSGIIISSSLLTSKEVEVLADNVSPTYVTKLPQEINLNKSSNDEIRQYYSSLNSLNNEERKGQNLLKNLRPILQKMDYYSYDNIWKIYEITDREWELSPASDTTYGTYNASTNTISNYEYGSNKDPKNNPYVKTLYRNKDEQGVTVSEGRIKEWGSHDKEGTNREHIWCQSRGFKADSGAKGPAGTDLHHLRSGDDYVNSSLHNDNPYGYVDKSKSYEDGANEYSFLKDNYKGYPLHTSSNDEGTVVFEPQDSDKGDIARAIFYMAATYNNLAGTATITEFNPNLTIVDYIYNADGRVESNETTPASMSKLSDLLEWHKLDPVDEFEIYRNDLIYNNYQHNRNPFIDYPDWVDVVWGKENKIASPSSDIIHGSALSINKTNVSVDIAKTNTFTLTATTIDDSTITWSISDTSIVSASKLESSSNEEVTFTVLKEGEVTIKATATIEGKEYQSTCKINITKGFVLEPWMIIVAVAIVVILIIILIISSTARKHAKKAVKKMVKKKKSKKQ